MIDKGLDSFLKAIKLKEQFLDEVVKIGDATERNGEYTKPHPIGYSFIDAAIKGGVREGNLVVITGKSGCGKTLFLQNISTNLSNLGYKSLWFSYEVVIDDIYAKFNEMGVADDNLLVYVPKQMTTGNMKWIQEKTQESINKYGVKFIFIDHIDFLSPKKINNADQYRIVLKNICEELKEMALKLKVIVFLVAHVKKVQGREIEMQDIGESSYIFKLSDLVLCANRGSKITEVLGKKVEVFTNEGYLNVLKNRITGICPFMTYTVVNSRIIVLGGVNPQQQITEYKQDNESINVEEL